MNNLIEDLLPKTLYRERERLERNLERARERGLPATLTLFQWIRILDFFKWKCVLCKAAPAESMEHAIPLREGGGTTATNCLPVCKACHEAQNTMQGRSSAALNRLQRLE